MYIFIARFLQAANVIYTNQDCLLSNIVTHIKMLQLYSRNDTLNLIMNHSKLLVYIFHLASILFDLIYIYVRVKTGQGHA